MRGATCRCSSTSGPADSELKCCRTVADARSPLSTLLFPLVVPPASDGWSWPIRSFPDTPPKDVPPRSSEECAQGDGPGGLYVMGGADELTDDEGGGGGWWEDDDEGHERRELQPAVDE